MKTRSLGQTFSWIILIALIVAGFSVVRVAAAVGPDPSPSDPASAGVWSALGAGTNGDVHTIVIDGSDVYVGGAFTSAGNCNSSAGCNNIARWDGSKWHPLGTGTNDEVDTIAISGSDVYVGGNFTSAGSCNIPAGCNNIARWNGSSWSALGKGVDDQVYSIVTSGSNVYASGNFSSAGSCDSAAGCNFIAKWNGASWSALGKGMDATVFTLFISGSNLYAGGFFYEAGTCKSKDGCNAIARWDGSKWYPLGMGMNGYVLAILANGSNVYAAGLFDSAGTCNSSAGCNNIARWDGSKWNPLGTGVNNAIVNLVSSGSSVYAGGVFSSAGGCNSSAGCNDIARWDGSKWYPLGGGVSSAGGGKSVVRRMAINGASLYAVGLFSKAGSCTTADGCNNIARFTPATYTKTYNSIGTQDGWILESAKCTGLGGSLNSTAATFQLGDDALNRQYRAVLSFNTAGLPDNALIQSAVLKLKPGGAPVGLNLFTALGSLRAAIRKGYFGSSSSLQTADFNAPATASGVGTFGSTPSGGWYSAGLNATGLGDINKTGLTQFRLAFSVANNNNLKADYMKFASGDAGSAMPQLVIVYTLP